MNGSTTQRGKVAPYIDPSSHHFLGDRLFIVEDGRLCGDRINAPFAHLGGQWGRVFLEGVLPKRNTGLCPVRPPDILSGALDSAE